MITPSQVKALDSKVSNQALTKLPNEIEQLNLKLLSPTRHGKD